MELTRELPAAVTVPQPCAWAGFQYMINRGAIDEIIALSAFHFVLEATAWIEGDTSRNHEQVLQMPDFGHSPELSQ